VRTCFKVTFLVDTSVWVFRLCYKPAVHSPFKSHALLPSITAVRLLFLTVNELLFRQVSGAFSLDQQVRFNNSDGAVGPAASTFSLLLDVSCGAFLDPVHFSGIFGIGLDFLVFIGFSFEVVIGSEVDSFVAVRLFICSVICSVISIICILVSLICIPLFILIIPAIILPPVLIILIFLCIFLPILIPRTILTILVHNPILIIISPMIILPLLPVIIILLIIIQILILIIVILIQRFPVPSVIIIIIDITIQVRQFTVVDGVRVLELPVIVLFVVLVLVVLWVFVLVIVLLVDLLIM
jgi:hypothetical protein